MKTITNIWIEAKLAEEMNGKCYEHIWVTLFGNSYAVNKDYYMVENGEVFLINDGTKQKTGDSLERTKNECVCIGDYKPNKPYEKKIKYYTPAEIKKLLDIQ